VPGVSATHHEVLALGSASATRPNQAVGHLRLKTPITAVPSRARAATTPHRLSQGRRPQTPQPPHPRPESRVGIRNHEAGRSLSPDPQDTGRSEWMFQQALSSVRTVRNSKRANQRTTEGHRAGVARVTGHGGLPDRAGSPRGVRCRPLHMRAPRTNHLASQHTVRGHD
jgi:hypothetical protein